MASWTKGLFDCFSGDWLCACCCPCVMYSRVQHRLSHPEDAQMSEFSNCNASCWGWYCLQAFTGCGGTCLQCFQRQDIREKLAIDGSLPKDCVLAWCCHCCVFVQEEEELKIQRQRLLSPAAVKQEQFAQQQPMTYAPPPGQQATYPAAEQTPYPPQQPHNV